MKTATGNFPLGWRRRNYAWEQDLDGMIAWALDNDLEVVDLGQDADCIAGRVVEAGLRIGTADMNVWHEMISPDAAVRREAVARNAEYARACAAAGAVTFFVVMLPEDPSRPRAENFGYMIDSYGELATTFEDCGAYLAIEGWPGPGALVCTPEAYRAFIEQVGSPNMGVNYDPSHLVRMGIDPIRFLKEFVGSVFHVHGKDCMIINENLYQYGNLQEATFGAPFKYGGMNWRYTIPGHGLSDWNIILDVLKDSGYSGCVSIELEDHYYDDTEADQKLGVLQGVKFLAGT
ncbi:MAG: sugar phosphate isomerase/epimerase [Chloroflexota bacterium]|nr:sugar phosphate isomerase/epimerase [Chloroflexota bacterium]MDE2908717.1 sugar phosphate isomerase/epimerase [Chloroflexota bacterium]